MNRMPASMRTFQEHARCPGTFVQQNAANPQVGGASRKL
ncbi:MAG: hypothetical protein AVDCRST_MAG93-8538 [uncultured Chloroflexia bacterium]|uniref:Uncharacterized protein n=1 Tax=uncultured Chloroflexia bacterium TaxID=1672391 RepID=A0A6J4MYQ0_9CHLR|nr:MAG: hypothetical protein AVDCRST_MAG93-8538 [uncultured Chloroflexia bacterium]